MGGGTSGELAALRPLFAEMMILPPWHFRVAVAEDSAGVATLKLSVNHLKVDHAASSILPWEQVGQQAEGPNHRLHINEPPTEYEACKPPCQEKHHSHLSGIEPRTRNCLTFRSEKHRNERNRNEIADIRFTNRQSEPQPMVMFNRDLGVA